MKPKNLIILVIILAVLAGLSFLVKNKQPTKSSKKEIGGEFITNLPVNDIASITIHSEEEKLTLGKKDDKWVVKTRYDYPADFKKIKEFVLKLKESKIGRSFKASDATISRLGMKKPDDEKAKEDEKGMIVTLSDKDNKQIAQFTIGNTRDTDTGSGGQYIYNEEDSLIYLLDKVLKYTEKESSGWLEKELLDVKAEDIEKVECVNEEDVTVYTVKRPEKGKKPELLTPVPEGRKLKSSELDSLFRSISSLRIEDVLDPAEKVKDNSKLTKVTFSKFDGTSYTFYPHKVFKDDEDKHCVRLEVSFVEPPKPEVEKADAEAEQLTPDKTVPVKEDEEAKKEEDKEKEPEKTPEELAYEAQNLNKKLNGWTYILSKWKFENFVTEMDEFLEEVKKKEVKKKEDKE